MSMLQPSGACPLEDNESLRIIKDLLFKVIVAGRNHKDNAGSISPVQDSALLTYPDYRDFTEEIMYLFCSFAMSLNFSVDQICSFILPIGVSVLQHCVFAIQKSFENPNDNNLFWLSTFNAVLESLMVLLRDEEKNKKILTGFDVPLLLIEAVKIL